jgi:hypothetical protein
MLLAASSDTGVSVPILLGAAALALVWLGAAALVLTLRRPPRVRPAGGGIDLPPESPAVAGMLGTDFVVPSETAPAVLLDLAARRLVDLDEVQPGKTICRLRRRDGETLTAVERRILAALESRAIDGVVPAEALTTGTEDRSRGWHRDLAREVIEESHQAGLTYDRWPRAWAAGLGVGLGVVLLAVVAAMQVGGDVEPADELPAGIAVAVVASVLAFGIVLVARLGRSLAQLPTPAGLEAAARVEGLEQHFRDNSVFDDLPPAAVKVRGRHLAYAAALGAAHLAVELLPMGAEDDHRAWSRVGGRWRRVRVRYPRWWPPGWGLHPALAALAAVAIGAVAGFAASLARRLADSDPPVGVTDDWDWVQLVGDILFAVFIATVVWAAVRLLLAVSDVFASREVAGEIVRSRRFKRSSSNNNVRYAYYLAVDDGSDERLPAFRVRQEIWNAHSQGDTVTTVVSPRLGYVRSISRS